MAIQDYKINSTITTVQGLNDRPQLGTTLALKEKFDHSPELIRQALNNLIDFLYTYYASKTDLQNTTLGQIIDGSITPAKLSFDPATQAELDAFIPKLVENILTTQGDLLGRDGTGPIRIPKGAAYQVFGMNSGATAQQYMASVQSLLLARGDIIVANGANTPAILTLGALGYSLISNGTDLVYGFAKPIVYQASENVLESANTERSTTQQTYQTVKTFKINRKGTVRITWDLKSTNGSYLADGRILVDGVYVANQNTSSTSYVTKTRDVTVNDSSTIDVQINIANASASCYIKNVSMRATETISNTSVILD